jgi:ORF6N domain-containing protein
MAPTSKSGKSPALVAPPVVEKRIRTVRDRQVMLDEDLAELYGVETKRLIQQVKRNAKRLPEEAAALRSQIATSNERGGHRYLPYAFTKQGVALLLGVGEAPRAARAGDGRATRKPRFPAGRDLRDAPASHRAAAQVEEEGRVQAS